MPPCSDPLFCPYFKQQLIDGPKIGNINLGVRRYMHILGSTVRVLSC